MEPRFGHDFGDVRIHTGDDAARSAKEVGASAYTIGNRIVFGAAYPAPNLSESRRLLAHELAHIVQQRGHPDDFKARTARLSLPSDPEELAAESAAAGVLAGNNAVGLSRTDTPVIQRSGPSDAGDLTKVPHDLTCPAVLGPPDSPVGTAIIFATDSAATTGREWVARAWVKLWVEHGSIDDVVVDGYASTPGSQEHNWRLSCKRAEAVRDLLVSLGVPSGKIAPKAHGEASRFDASDPLRNQRAVISPGYKGTAPSVTGLAARKAALLAAGGTLLDMAIAMLETSAMQVDYPLGDIDPSGKPKTGDAANFGIFKQNWKDIRESGAMPATGPGGAGLAATDWATRGPLLNTDLGLDVNVLHASQKRLGTDKWLAAHRQGESGRKVFEAAAGHASLTGAQLGLLSDIENYTTGVRWIEDQLRRDPALQTDDRKPWVQVPAV